MPLPMPLPMLLPIPLPMPLPIIPSDSSANVAEKETPGAP